MPMLKKTLFTFVLLVCITLFTLPALALAKSYLIIIDQITYDNAKYDYNYGSLAMETADAITAAYKDAKAEVRGVDLTQSNIFEPFLTQNYDLIITIGNDVCTLARNAAKDNPDQKFALIDFGEADLPPNACSYRFDGSEGAFLAGFLAARMTSGNQVGFIGGMVFPQVQKMGQAFAAGARYARPGIVVESVYMNDFFDIAGGHATADLIYDNNVQVIFHAAGVSGHGVIEAADEKEKFVIGVDADQRMMAPDNVLTSVIIDLNMAVLDACNAVENDTFPAGRRLIMNLANGGVRLGAFSNVPPQIIETVHFIQEGIIIGSIVINKTL